jgi:putative membrane protein
MSEQESNRIRRIVGLGIIGLIVVIGLSIALSHYFAPWRPGGFDYPFVFFPFHFGWLGAIFLIFIVLLVAKWFFWPRRGEYYSYPHQQRADPASIVRERYAKGEISREQFEQMLRDLRQEDG